MLVSMSVDIEAPADRVWPYLVEPDKAKMWFTELPTYEWTSEPGGVGSTFYWLETRADTTTTSGSRPPSGTHLTCSAIA